METKDKEIINALIKAETAIEVVKKTSTNPFFHSKFADLSQILEAIKKPLADNGLGFTQSISKIDNDFYLKTTLIHASGQTLEFRYPVFFAKKEVDAQSFGAGVTYAKRYALQALFGIATEDDDGETAVGREQKEVSFEQKILNEIAADKSLTEKIRKLGMTKRQVLDAFAEFKSLDRLDEVLANEIAAQELRKKNSEAAIKESLDNLRK